MRFGMENKSLSGYGYLIVFTIFLSLQSDYDGVLAAAPATVFSSTRNSSWLRKLVPNKFDMTRFSTNPFFNFDDDDNDNNALLGKTTIKEVVPPLMGNILTTVYGITLLWNTAACTGQLRTMTMIRATGSRRWDEVVTVTKRNIRDASWTAIQRVPSFYLASRSMKRFDNRIVDIRKLMVETKKAKADGIVTPDEARKLQRQRRRQIKNLRRDMRRLANAGKNLRYIVEALDVGDILDIVQTFAFQLLTILSVRTGTALAEEDDEEKKSYQQGEGVVVVDDSSITSTITDSTKKKETVHPRKGLLVFNSCLFQNLASLALDVNTKLEFPISATAIRLISYLTAFSQKIRTDYNHVDTDDNDDDSGTGAVAVVVSSVDEGKLKMAGTFVTYGVSGYLVVAKHRFARKVNNALLSASVVLRGLKGIVKTLMLYWDADDVEEFINNQNTNRDGKGSYNSQGLLPSLNRFLNGRGGGIIMVTLSATSLILRHVQAKKQARLVKQQQQQQEKQKQKQAYITTSSDNELNSIVTEKWKNGDVSIAVPTSYSFSSIIPPRWIQNFHSTMEYSIDRMADILEETL